MSNDETFGNFSFALCPPPTHTHTHTHCQILIQIDFIIDDKKIPVGFSKN